jgi:hypothetical protein
MRESITLFLLLFSLTVFATEQTPDILIYQSDTIFIDTYPLEKMMESDSILRKKIFEYSDNVFLSSGCWRGHVATWKIENDSLFLIKLISGVENYDFNLENVFGTKKVKEGQVFAHWFSGNIKADFGRYLSFDIENFEDVYSKNINCKVINGKIENVKLNEKSDCEVAMILAQKDFEDSNYSFHSVEFLPVENTYTYVLDKYYDIKWYFTDSLEYYHCYDSIMTIKLKSKYGSDFLEKAEILADSLEQTENWISNAEYIGGQQELMRFLMTRLKIDSTEMNNGIRTKLFIEIEIDSTGKVVNPIIRKGIGERTDQKVMEIIKNMPKWKPAYLYGRPIRQRYFIPLNIDYQ